MTIFWVCETLCSSKSQSFPKRWKWKKVKSLSRVWLFATPWTVAYQLLRPWDFPGKSTGVGSHFLLQGSSRPRNWTQVSFIAGRRFTLWATREAYTFKCIYHSLLNHSYVWALRMLLVFFNYSAAMNNPAFILLQLFLQNRFLGMRLLCQKVRVYTFVAYCQILFQKGIPDCISTGSACITFP